MYEQYYVYELKKIEEKYKRKNTIKKYQDLIYEEIKTIKTLGDIEQLNISVEWRKSSIWGMNPYCRLNVYPTHWDHKGDVETYFDTTTSGCGYDKESICIALALNKSLHVKKWLMDNWVDGEKQYLGYGAIQYEKGDMPHFNGGVGVECYERIFKNHNFNFISMHGKVYDAYIITKGEK